MPKFTVLTNIDNGHYVGTQWEFFDSREDAEACYNKHVSQGHCPTLRPFHEGCDRQHMGAAHR